MLNALSKVIMNQSDSSRCLGSGAKLYAKPPRVKNVKAQIRVTAPKTPRNQNPKSETSLFGTLYYHA